MSIGNAKGNWKAATALGVEKSGAQAVPSVNIKVIASIVIALMICRFAAAGKIVGVLRALMPSFNQVTSEGPADSPLTTTVEGMP